MGYHPAFGGETGQSSVEQCDGDLDQADGDEKGDLRRAAKLRTSAFRSIRCTHNGHRLTVEKWSISS